MENYFFLTADHCTSGLDAVVGSTNADDWSFVWNYEAPSCGIPSTEPPLYVTNGAKLLANNSVTDFALFELIESPLDLNLSQQIVFNGWDRTNLPPSGGVGIHHPMGDIKKISTYNMTPISNTNCSNTPQHFWEINWATTANGHSVQQPGSSGSPLFSNDGLILGQLYGPKFCQNIQCESPADQEVVYGRFSSSWSSNSDYRRQLKHWLGFCSNSEDYLVGGYWECLNTLLIDYPIYDTRVMKANQIINANSIIGSSAKVTLKAGFSLTLSPGFSTESGSEFTAMIAPCESEFVDVAHKRGGIAKPILTEKNKLIISDFQFRVFPNPTKGKFNLKVSVQKAGVIQVLVTNVLGKENIVRYSQFAQKGEFQTSFDLVGHPKGIYLLTVVTSEYRETYKIVLE